MIAEVALNVPLRRQFDYALPSGGPAVLPGMRVVVPFGHRRLTGVVVHLKPETDIEPERLRTIYRVLDETTIFTEEMFRFTRWVADYYVSGWGEVLDSALPAGLGGRFRTRYRLVPGEDAARVLAGLPDAVRELIHREPLWSASQITRAAGRDPQARATVQGWLARTTAAIDSPPEPGTGSRIDTTGAPATGEIAYASESNGAHASGVAPLEVILEPEAPAQLKESRWVRLTPAGIPKDEPGGVSPSGDAVPGSTPVLRHAKSRRDQLLRLLATEGPLRVAALKAHLPAPTPVVNRLVKEGLAEIFLRTEGPRVQPVPVPAPEPFHTLTDQQAAVVETVREALEARQYAAFLIDGVTGSGKTEIYLHAVRDVLEQGRSALVLVPEIALTAEIQHRFRSRFGTAVAVLHSGMDQRVRQGEWMRARSGTARVVIGARSAVFAPLPQLGLIVVDEEHDGAYKQDETPRYHSRDAALVRARDNKAVVVLGSATPSMESLHNVALGKLKRLVLTERVENRPLPQVKLINMRQARRQKGSALFSREMLEALRTTVSAGQQAILFLNRRGFAQLVQCEVCGETVLCQNCSLSLVYHRVQGRLRCHHCDYWISVPEHCPACDAAEMKILGLGTERIEEEVGKLIPRARVLRLDSDSIRRRGALESLLGQIRRREADVIVGTQILTKGHDFPDITLVAAVLADVSLNLPDFRAAERTFQVLTQMAGRAGRGDMPGTVMIQTYNPQHHALVHVADHSTARFAEIELAQREHTRTPPYSHLVLFWVSSPHADRAAKLAQAIARRLRDWQEDAITVDGPSEAPIQRIKRRYRWVVLLRSTRVARMRQLAETILADPVLGGKPPERVVVDVDPQNLL